MHSIYYNCFKKKKVVILLKINYFKITLIHLSMKFKILGICKIKSTQIYSTFKRTLFYKNIKNITSNLQMILTSLI